MNILDKKGLHPIGGYCTCFSNPYSPCDICIAILKFQKRWKSLTKEEKLQATREYKKLYPQSSNQDGR